VRLNAPDYRPSVESFDLSVGAGNPAAAPKLQQLDTVRIFSGMTSNRHHRCGSARGAGTGQVSYVRPSTPARRDFLREEWRRRSSIPPDIFIRPIDDEQVRGIERAAGATPPARKSRRAVCWPDVRYLPGARTSPPIQPMVPVSKSYRLKMRTVSVLQLRRRVPDCQRQRQVKLFDAGR